MAKIWFLILVTICSASLSAISQTDKKNKNPSPPDTVESRLIQINNIYIIGNDKTKPHIITRELNIAKGEYVPSDELDELVKNSQINVYNTNLFSTVEIQKLELDSMKVDLMVKVEERWYVWPSPVFRLADKNFNDWWYNRNHDLSRTKYGVKLDIYNFRGQKENLRLIALGGYERRLIFQYSIPYIDKGQRHGLTFGGGYLQNKRLFYQTADHITVETGANTDKGFNKETSTAYVIYTFRPSFYNYHYVLLQGYGMNISDSVASLNPRYFRNGATSQQALSLSYTFSRDRRNNKNYPLQGYLTFAMLEKLGLGVFQDIDIWRLTGNYYQYFDLGNKFFASTSLGAQVTTSKNVPYFNYTQFGLENYYVRGYELNIIEGPHNVLTKNSLKYQILKTKANLGRAMPLTKFRKIPFAFYGKIIADGGWVNNYSDYEIGQRLTNKLLYGVGIGLDMVTLYDITFRFEYTYNAEGDLNFFINFRSEL